jgi:hypothetical protein
MFLPQTSAIPSAALTITRRRYTTLFDRSSQRPERGAVTIPCLRERGSSRTPPCKQGCPEVYSQPSKKISLRIFYHTLYIQVTYIRVTYIQITYTQVTYIQITYTQVTYIRCRQYCYRPIWYLELRLCDVTPHILHLVTADCEKFNKRGNVLIYNVTLWHFGTILIPPRVSQYFENKSV